MPSKQEIIDDLESNHGLFLKKDARLATLRDALADIDGDDIGAEEIARLRDSSFLYSRAVDGDLVVPSFGEFSGSLKSIYDKVKDQDGGDVARYIPQLARVDPDQFGVSVCTIDGQRASVGESDRYFCIQSTSKPLTYGMALEEAIQEHGIDAGEDYVHKHVGREPSGRGFNERVLNPAGLPHNPCINSGAIMCASFIKPELTQADRFDYVIDKWTELCGRTGRVAYSNSTFLSEQATADRNFCLGYMMQEEKCFPEGTDLMKTEDLYFMMCSIEITTEMMAVVAATLANGGTNPLTGVRIFSERTVRDILSITASCGMYDESGRFLFEIGFPAKSGVGGGIMIVIPGKMGMATWSPRLDSHGNSVRGVKFCRELTSRFNFHQYDDLVRDHHSKVDPCARPRFESEEHQTTELMWRAYAGSIAQIRSSLAAQAVHTEDGAPISVVTAADYDARTALHVACAEGHADIVRALLVHGADPHVKDNFGTTPKDSAKGHPECLALLEKAADLKRYDVAQSVDAQLFRALDLEGTGKVTASQIKKILKVSGYSYANEPHLKAIYGELRKVEELDESSFIEFSQRHTLLGKIVRNELTIPDYTAFEHQIQEIYDLVEPDHSGANADYIPSLAKADPEKFGISICTLSGQQLDIGDSDVPFGMQSMTKVINYCIAQTSQGVDKVQKHVGVEPSGRPFNEICLDEHNLPHNPCINAGAMMTCSMIDPPKPVGEQFATIEETWNRLTGGSRVSYNNSMYLGERATADRNFSLGYYMKGCGSFPEWVKTADDLIATLELYFMTCSIEITSHQMAVVAATLANGGTNPLTGEEIFRPDVVRNALSVMATCGMYDWSGEFAFRIGFPCKSGVGGGLMIVIPGKMGIATFSPRLDSCGNSQRGNGVCKELTRRFNFHMYDGIVRGKYDPTIPGGSHVKSDISELLTAAHQDNTTEIRRLVQSSSIDVNSADYDERTALHLAVEHGNIAAVNLLLQLGHKTDHADRWGNTPADSAKKFSDKFPEVAARVAQA